MFKKYLKKFSSFIFHRSSQKGFTLVELLVSSAILITVGTIIIVILSVSFKVSQRTEQTLLLKNTGSNALTQIVNNIKYAKNLNDPTNCYTPVVQDSITVTSAFDGGQTVFSCPTEMSPTIASNGASLVDTNSVFISACSFSCSQTNASGVPTITIDFSLGVVNASSLGQNTDTVIVPFHTSVTMRNFIQ